MLDDIEVHTVPFDVAGQLEFGGRYHCRDNNARPRGVAVFEVWPELNNDQTA